MASKLLPFSSFVLDVTSVSPPEMIGSALAKLWIVNEQKLLSISDGVECPITLESMKKPVLLSDGTIYEESPLARWLQVNNTAPTTNLILEHRQFLRLQPLKTVIEHFLNDNGLLKICTEKALERAIQDAKVQDIDPCVRAKQLEAQIDSALIEVEKLQVLIREAQVVAAQICAEIQVRKLSCTIRLQAFVRCFLAKCEAGKRRETARINAHKLICATKIQAFIRGFCARREADKQHQIAKLAAKRQFAAATSIQKHWRTYVKRLAKRAKRRRAKEKKREQAEHKEGTEEMLVSREEISAPTRRKLISFKEGRKEMLRAVALSSKSTCGSLAKTSMNEDVLAETTAKGFLQQNLKEWTEEIDNQDHARNLTAVQIRNASEMTRLIQKYYICNLDSLEVEPSWGALGRSFNEALEQRDSERIRKLILDALQNRINRSLTDNMLAALRELKELESIQEMKDHQMTRLNLLKVEFNEALEQRDPERIRKLIRDALQNGINSSLIDNMLAEFQELKEFGDVLEESESESESEVDRRSIYVGQVIDVGQVDYGEIPEELQEHFQSCGAINMIEIKVNKWTGQSKGFAYIEFADEQGFQNSLLLNESLFRGRQLKVMPKQTNIPGFNFGKGDPPGKEGKRKGKKRKNKGFGKPSYPPPWICKSNAPWKGGFKGYGAAAAELPAYMGGG